MLTQNILSNRYIVDIKILKMDSSTSCIRTWTPMALIDKSKKIEFNFIVLNHLITLIEKLITNQFGSPRHSIQYLVISYQNIIFPLAFFAHQTKSATHKIACSPLPMHCLRLFLKTFGSHDP